ncbi:MAG TPA: hypothetical protein VFH43_07840, partial [Candidatus Kapabacteria bacterium]|nr:hypothetical protein [Candidatus Kapabacteria bacterium]
MEIRAMRKRYGFWAAKMAIVLAVLSVSFSAQAQLILPKFYPTLSVTNWRAYPDGIIRVPSASPGGERYFLVPVFIYNEVDPAFNPNIGGQRLEPIRSFEFQLEYFNQAMVLDENPEHGSPIVVIGPSKSESSQPALAKNFYIRYTDQPDPGNPADTTGKPFNPFRRRIRIAAASEIPLPMANQSDTSQNVLLYIRFKTIPSAINQGLLALDTSRFNDHYGDSLINALTYTRGNFGGIDEPYTKRGTGTVQITPQPSIELRPLSQITTEDNRNFVLLPDLIYDPAVAAGQTPERSLQLRNGQSGSRLTNISICTDQPWLNVSTSPGGGQQCIEIPRIDYTAASGSEERDLWISANPGGLQPGIYYGYVTIESEGASNSPTRILVKFIYRRTPDEPGAGGQNTGIRLSLTNSCSIPCTSNLIFGVGAGASAGIDPLFGETTFTGDDRTARDTNVIENERCFAYFEPLDRTVDIQYNDPNILGTIRDVRSNVNPGTQLYKVVFDAGDPLCYPVTVCVNPADFPAGARIIARDILNGGIFSVNLREGTQNGDERCFVIRDTRITSFIIEYTPGTIGTIPSVVSNGWNLVSLPVIPPDTRATTIFPDAAGTPFEYTAAAAWVPREDLEFGRGYMVKFGDFIGSANTNIAGVVSNSVSDVRIFRGWNTIGASSVPVNVDHITFTPLAGSSVVPVAETDVFEYVTGRGYRQVAYLIPGRGYFVKASADGYYNLLPPKMVAAPKADITENLSKLTVRDNGQNTQELFFGNVATDINPIRYELPPTVFGLDARFNSNRGYVAFNENSYVVSVKTKSYPVALNFEGITSEVEVRDMNGNVLGTAVNGGSVVINDSKINQVEVSYKGGSNGRVNNMGFGLEQSSPNPFTTSTNISFSLPTEMPASVVVYNQLGQVVATLFDGTGKAGVNNVT